MAYGNGNGGGFQKKPGSGSLWPAENSRYDHLSGDVLGHDGQDHWLNATFKVARQGSNPLPPEAQQAVDQICYLMRQHGLRLTIRQGDVKQQQQGAPQGAHQGYQQAPQGYPPQNGQYPPPQPQNGVHQGYQPHPAQQAPQGGYQPHPQQQAAPPQNGYAQASQGGGFGGGFGNGGGQGNFR